MPDDPCPEKLPHDRTLNVDLMVSAEPRAESDQSDFPPSTVIDHLTTDIPKAEIIRASRSVFEPWKATYENVSKDFREDKKNEAIAGLLMIGAMFLSWALSFGKAWIAIPLFFLIYPAVGLGYSWLRGKQTFEKFGDFVVESTTFSLFIVLSLPALGIAAGVIAGILERMLPLSLFLAAVLVIYCCVAFKILVYWRRLINWVVNRMGTWKIWKRLSTSFSKASSTRHRSS